MNKRELARAVAEQTGMSVADAEAAVNATITVIAGELAEGGDVRIPGFGNFTVTERAARAGRNPQTGEYLDIPARKMPKFAPGKTLRDMMIGGPFVPPKNW